MTKSVQRLKLTECKRHHTATNSGPQRFPYSICSGSYLFKSSNKAGTTSDVISGILSSLILLCALLSIDTSARRRLQENNTHNLMSARESQSCQNRGAYFQEASSITICRSLIPRSAFRVLVDILGKVKRRVSFPRSFSIWLTMTGIHLSTSCFSNFRLLRAHSAAPSWSYREYQRQSIRGTSEEYIQF
jgi:hypothetical protein